MRPGGGREATDEARKSPGRNRVRTPRHVAAERGCDPRPFGDQPRVRSRSPSRDDLRAVRDRVDEMVARCEEEAPSRPWPGSCMCLGRLYRWIASSTHSHKDLSDARCDRNATSRSGFLERAEVPIVLVGVARSWRTCAPALWWVDSSSSTLLFAPPRLRERGRPARPASVGRRGRCAANRAFFHLGEPRGRPVAPSGAGRVSCARFPARRTGSRTARRPPPFRDRGCGARAPSPRAEAHRRRRGTGCRGTTGAAASTR